MTPGRHDSGTSSIHTDDVGLTSMWNVNSHQWRRVDIWAKFGHCHCCCCCCCRRCSSNINNNNNQVWPKCQPDVIDVNSHQCQPDVIGVNWWRPGVMTSRRHWYHEIDQSPTKRSDCKSLREITRVCKSLQEFRSLWEFLRVWEFMSVFESFLEFSHFV